MKALRLFSLSLACLVLAALFTDTFAAGAVVAPSLPGSLHGSIRSVKTGEKVVALTFDLCESAGSVAGYDAVLVDYLRANGVKATFFAGGKWLRSHPVQAAQLLSDPLFEVGSHGWSHRNLRQAAARTVADEVGQAQTTLDGLRTRQPGQVPAGPALFRFPYGTCSPAALAYVNAQGLAAIQWDVVTGDPDRHQDAAAIARAVLSQVHPGAIVIAHANGRGWHTAAALPLFIPQLRKQGYRFVTVGELLAMGEPIGAGECYELKPGDNRRYDHQPSR